MTKNIFLKSTFSVNVKSFDHASRKYLYDPLKYPRFQLTSEISLQFNSLFLSLEYRSCNFIFIYNFKFVAMIIGFYSNFFHDYLIFV